MMYGGLRVADRKLIGSRPRSAAQYVVWSSEASPRPMPPRTFYNSVHCCVNLSVGLEDEWVIYLWTTDRLRRTMYEGGMTVGQHCRFGIDLPSNSGKLPVHLTRSGIMPVLTDPNVRNGISYRQINHGQSIHTY